MNRPAADAFMADEADALVDELRSRPDWAFEYAEGVEPVPCKSDDMRPRFDGRLRDFTAAKTQVEPRFLTANSFARFVQDVLRVVLVRGPADAVIAWRGRQDRFKMAVKAYLPEFEMREEAAVVGEHYSRWASRFDCIKFPASRSEPGRKNGEVMSTIAPRLVYEPMTYPLNGALFYWSDR